MNMKFDFNNTETSPHRAMQKAF